MIRIGNRGAKRANLSAFRSLIETDTFCAFVGLNLINNVSLADGLVWTLQLTGAASRTFGSNFVSHLFLLGMLVSYFHFLILPSR
jgi:hypothetical protein